MPELLRGHPIELSNGEYIYTDTQTPTAGNERDCGHCGKPNTKEGYDGCLGKLPKIMSACCGHGEENEAYLQSFLRVVTRGKQAIKLINKQKERENDRFR